MSSIENGTCCWENFKVLMGKVTSCARLLGMQHRHRPCPRRVSILLVEEHVKESLQARCVLMKVCTVVIRSMEEDAPYQSSILRGLCQNIFWSFADCVCYGFERSRSSLASYLSTESKCILH